MGNFCIASCSFLQHLSSCWGSGLPIFDRLRNGLRPVLYSIMLAFSNFLVARGSEIPIRSAEGRGSGFGRSLWTFFVMRLVLLLHFTRRCLLSRASTGSLLAHPALPAAEHRRPGDQRRGRHVGFFPTKQCFDFDCVSRMC